MTVRHELRRTMQRTNWPRKLSTMMLLGLGLSGAAHLSGDGSTPWGMAGLTRAGGSQAGSAGELWTGSSHITFSRKTNDFTIGYTMRSDFWFRVGSEGKVRGKAYAVYQPTFDAAGMNGKITVAKSVFSGALGLLPGGQIGVYKSAIEAGKAGTNVALGGLVGVVGEYEDPKPVRTGEITGTLRDPSEVGGGTTGSLTLAWADESAQPSGIPAKISLQYINKKQPIANPTLEIQTPWHMPAAIDADSGGRVAIAQDQ